MDVRDEEVYAKYADELLRFAATLTTPADAEDLLSAAVLKAFTSPSWRDVEFPRAYLYRAVLNEARQTSRGGRRRSAREVRVAVTEEVASSSVRPEVLAAVRQLSLEQRAVVFMTYWLDLSIDDVAYELGLSRRTTERRLQAARRALRGALL
jgi:RNA polymerase sigma-70 factor (ECF subfamily)